MGSEMCIRDRFLVSADKKNIAGTHHPDNGMINASNVINIISLIGALLGLGLYLIFFIFLGGIGAFA